MVRRLVRLGAKSLSRICQISARVALDSAGGGRGPPGLETELQRSEPSLAGRECRRGVNPAKGNAVGAPPLRARPSSLRPNRLARVAPALRVPPPAQQHETEMETLPTPVRTPGLNSACRRARGCSLRRSGSCVWPATSVAGVCRGRQPSRLGPCDHRGRARCDPKRSGRLPLFEAPSRFENAGCCRDV